MPLTIEFGLRHPNTLNFPNIQKMIYDSDYFENGVEKKISGYTNYSWMPELTLPLAEYMAEKLSLSGISVLDYGCAKGFLVKAFRQIDITCFGFDISSYAISQVPKEISKYCFLRDSMSLPDLLKEYSIEFFNAKDVFEHLSEDQLEDLLHSVRDSSVNSVFVAVPLSATNDEPYIINEYENDVTHILRKTKLWWETKLTAELEFDIQFSSYHFGPLKQNWVKQNPYGNLFILLKRRT